MPSFDRNGLKTGLCSGSSSAKHDIPNGYVSVMLPIFILFTTILVFILQLEYQYYLNVVKTREIARILAKSYGSSVIHWYMVFLGDCEIDLQCTSTDQDVIKKIQKQAYDEGSEILFSLQEKYGVEASPSTGSPQPEIELNEDIVFKIKAVGYMPISMANLPSEITQIAEYTVNLDDKNKL